MSFNIGDNVIYLDETGEHISTVRDIWQGDYGEYYYDILLPERNVMFENVEKFVKLNKEDKNFKKDDIVKYYKNANIFYGIVKSVDVPGKSLQIRILERSVPYCYIKPLDINIS